MGNLASPPPAGPATVATVAPGTTQSQRIQIPDGPITGPAGEDLLAGALGTMFGEGADGINQEPEGGASPGTAPGGAGAVTVTLPTDAVELKGLTDRATANGVSAEEQHQAETAELARLTTIAKEKGITVEQAAALEDTAPGSDAGKTFTQPEVEGMVQKRLANLKAENENLRQQLEEARSQKPEARSGPGVLDHITDPTKLAAFRSQAESGIALAERLLNTLNHNAGRVETELRRILPADALANIPEEDGKLTPEGMLNALLDSKEALGEQLKAVPKREAWLAENAKADGLVAKHPAFAFLNEPTDPRTQMFNRFAGQMPGIKASPAWRYWLGQAVRQHHADLAAMKQPAAGKFIPKVKFPVRAGGGTVPATARPGGGGGGLKQQTVAALKKNPRDENALATALAGLE